MSRYTLLTAAVACLCAIAYAVGAPPEVCLDAGPFAEIITCDPQRSDGSRANRIQEYHADDVFLESRVMPDADGNRRVPTYADGLGCVGLKWLESRRLQSVEVELAPDSAAPSWDDVRLQVWLGESSWQGGWKPLTYEIQKQDSGWRLVLKWNELPDAHEETRKIRLIFPSTPQPIVLSRLSARTATPANTVNLRIELAEPSAGAIGEIELYNGFIVTDDGAASVIRREWNLGSPLRVNVRYTLPMKWKTDRTVLRFTLPDAAFGVAVDDVLEQGAVFVPHTGVLVTNDAAEIGLDTWRERHADHETVLDQVRRLPDQTLARAMEKVHRPRQDSGPMMLSLPADNHKVVAQRDGTIETGRNPDTDGKRVSKMIDLGCRMVPTFGSGKHPKLTRELEGDWLPVPLTTVMEDGVRYRQRTFVAPWGGDTEGEPAKSICIAEMEIVNTSDASREASLSFKFAVDAEKNEFATPERVDYNVIAVHQDRLMAKVGLEGIGALTPTLTPAAVELRGTLPPDGVARCTVYLPRWIMSPKGQAGLSNAYRSLVASRQLWREMLSGTMQIEVPDPFVNNLIKASQVHCLLAARSEADGKRVAPWISSDRYGPLESEGHSIVRGMDFTGHHEFARRSLDFYIHRYNDEGFLTTGYTLMGTGWHLWMLGEHHALTRDDDWLRRVAPELVRVCRWVVEQRHKTAKPGPDGETRPESGLMPPGVMADWNAFAYYFCLNGYFHAGLRSAATALAAIDDPAAPELLAEADAFREDMLRAYHWAQARMPVFPLRDGRAVPGYPSQLHAPGPTANFFPGQDANRSWCYDVELGAHQLVPLGVLAPDSADVEWMMQHMEDEMFLREGWYDYPSEASRADPYNLGGFSKVQPYYCRNAEIYAMRDEVKPFIRAYFNTIPSLVSRENLSFWEHFNGVGGWNKTHETGYFLHQSRTMLVTERGDELWLAPFVTSNWIKDGMEVAVQNAPTRFGPVGYCIRSSVDSGFVEATIDPPTRDTPDAIVMRVRHPAGKPIRAVQVNGKPHADIDAEREIVRLAATRERINLRVEYSN